MKIIDIRGKILGKNNPAICIPITGNELKNITKQLDEAILSEPDIIELRIDLWQEQMLYNLSSILVDIRNRVKNIPLLITYRSCAEGGQGSYTVNEMVDLYHVISSCDEVDMIDIELSIGDELIIPILDKLKENKIKSVLSYHNFIETPDENFLMDKLKLAQDLGGDVAKIATMPSSKFDVIKVLSTTAKAYEKLDIPIISMSMGELGKISRISGGFFGSIITFASLKNSSSAPGQLEISKLKKILCSLRD
ncbi:type I 3-dehydroquinate dehydratase [Alkalibaculum sp. M08DMB]|uniref:3-dehydroquinate dehydratase n=1 Tax=Alkalibaculum sporogenes TaxID=2655001 RepID=A0A6A7K717_9FIRM|nr:type I 3-dehydroquinate dehydratase [Alkalibaculum sporogenes]MPW25131.1 type I 3-dehydroquinate dehydratase [Alkalibaculum sporogenes]